MAVKSEPPPHRLNLGKPVTGKIEPTVPPILKLKTFELCVTLPISHAILAIEITGAGFDPHYLGRFQAATGPLFAIFDVELTETVVEVTAEKPDRRTVDFRAFDVDPIRPQARRVPDGEPAQRKRENEKRAGLD